MIEVFPKFSKIKIAYQKEFEELTSRFDPYAEFSFPCLFCWDTEGTAEISTLNGNLVIRMPDYLTEEAFCSIIGNHKVDESIKTLLDKFGELKLVPEVVIDNLTNPENFLIVPDRDQFDYVYSLSEHVELPGKHFRGRRKKSGKFARMNGENLSVKKINFGNQATLDQIQQTFHEWAADRGRSHKDVSHEHAAITKLLKYAGHFNLIGLQVMIGKQTVGFSINEVVQNNFAICRFQKSVLSFRHLDAFLSNLVARELNHFGCEYISWEQDLGIEGLRKFKESYKPVKFLKKYSIKKT